ncbi:MAG: hypothetical protein GMKNLPBB_01998 [Myxococcota bacterium]|nr:hypothetical protein [Myxococcota bacterium]
MSGFFHTPMSPRFYEAKRASPPPQDAKPGGP